MMLRILLALLLFASPVSAAGPEIFFQSGGSSCAWSDSDASLLAENFNTNLDAWTTSGTSASSTVALAANTDIIGCDDCNVSMLQIVRGDANSPAATATLSSNGEHYGYLRFKIESTSVTAGNYQQLINAADSGLGHPPIVLGLGKSGTQLYAYIQHWDNGGGTDSYNLSGTDANLNVSTGTWYVLEWHWTQNQAVTGLTLSLGGTAITLSDPSTGNYASARIQLMITGYNATVDFETVKINAASAPGCD